MASATEHVLVTDGVSFLGSHVVRKLLLKGFYVRVAVMAVEHESEGFDQLREEVAQAEDCLRLVEVANDRPGSWLTAMQGCRYVVHTSAPLAEQEPLDDEELLKVVKEFTTFLLNTAQTAKIERFVLSSSPCNVFGNNTDPGRVYTEEDWADETNIHVYYKTKILAEKECWNYVEQQRDEDKFELSVVHPTIPVGPMLSEDFSYSADILSQLMTRTSKTLPHLQYALVDVRDAAAAHVAAMTVPEAAGKRHIVTATSLWVRQIAQVIRDEFSCFGYNPIVKETSSTWLKVLSWLDDSYRPIRKDLGKEIKLNNTRMRDVLGIQPRDIKTSIIEACHNLIDAGYVEVTSAYAEAYFVDTCDEEDCIEEEKRNSAIGMEQLQISDVSEKVKNDRKKKNSWLRKKLSRKEHTSKKDSKSKRKSTEGLQHETIT